MTETINQSIQDALSRAYVAAYRLLGNHDESNDACQEAAARAWAARERYDRSKPFYPWFYRILKNHCLDRLKQRRRVDGDTEKEPVEPGHSAEAEMMHQERSEAVTIAITRLPEDLREIIELRHFQELSYEEMASILDCPTGTVMSRLYRARKALRKILLQSPDFRFESRGEEKK